VRKVTHSMAEVLDYWPKSRKPAAQSMKYPWLQWMDMDDAGVGDIWLATLGIDWPETSNVANFRNILYTRAAQVNKRRQRDAPRALKAVDGKVRKVSTAVKFNVKIRVVSDTQIAFQFYNGDEQPPEPRTVETAIPVRRKPRGARTTALRPSEKVLVSR